MMLKIQLAITWIKYFMQSIIKKKYFLTVIIFLIWWVVEDPKCDHFHLSGFFFFNTPVTGLNRTNHTSTAHLSFRLYCRKAEDSSQTVGKSGNMAHKSDRHKHSHTLYVNQCFRNTLYCILMISRHVIVDQNCCFRE